MSYFYLNPKKNQASKKRNKTSDLDFVKPMMISSYGLNQQYQPEQAAPSR